MSDRSLLLRIGCFFLSGSGKKFLISCRTFFVSDHSPGQNAVVDHLIDISNSAAPVGVHQVAKITGIGQ